MSKIYAIKLDNGNLHKNNLGRVVYFTNKKDVRTYMKYNHYSGEIVKFDINVDKDKQISDLEAKLAESNESHHKNIVELTKTVTEKDRKIEELKQQLAEKEKEIETLKKCGDTEHFYGLLEDKKREIDICRKYIEKQDQDKISFAVEQLENVKELLLENLYDLYSKPSEIWDKYGDLYDVVVEGAVNGTIDNQIKQLKEGK